MTLGRILRFGAIEQVNNLFDGPNMVCNPSFHRGSDTQSLVQEQRGGGGLAAHELQPDRPLYWRVVRQPSRVVNPASGGVER